MSETPAPYSIGDAPIDPEYAELMRDMGRALDAALNAGPGEKVNGFILMMFPLGTHTGRCNYLSNAKREDVIVMLKEQLAKFEGSPDIKGRA